MGCSVARGLLAGGRRLVGLPASSLVVKRFENPRPQSLLQLEQEPDAGEVDAKHSREVADPGDATNVLVAVQAGVGRGPGGADKPLILVDPERTRVRRDDARCDADHVHRPTWIVVGPTVAHPIRPSTQPAAGRWSTWRCPRPAAPHRGAAAMSPSPRRWD